MASESENLTMEERYTEAMRLADYEKTDLLSDEGWATVAFRNRKTGERFLSDGWYGVYDYLRNRSLRNMIIEEDDTTEKIYNLISTNRKIDFYTEGDKTLIFSPFSRLFHGNLSEMMDKFKQLQGDKTIGIHIVEETGKEFFISLGQYIRSYLFNTQILFQSDAKFSEKVIKFPGDESRIREMYKELSEVFNHEKVHITVLDVLNELKNNAYENIMPFPDKTSWKYRVANSHRPQDYIEITTELNVEQEQIIFDAKAVHANEVVYITGESIDYDSIIENNDEKQFKWNDEFNRALEIVKLVELIDTDYEYEFDVYNEATMKRHYKKLNDLGYENEPDMPIELFGYENLQEVLDTMSNEDKEAHIQGVEAARDYNEFVSDFDQKLYKAIIEEKRNEVKTMANELEGLTMEERKLDFYIQGTEPPFYGNLSEVMDKFKQLQGNKIMGIHVTEKNGKDIYMPLALYTNSYSFLPKDIFNVQVNNFSGDESKIRKMYKELSDVVNYEKIQLVVLDVLNSIKNKAYRNIISYPDEKNWKSRVVNSYRPQDYIEITTELRVEQEQALFNVKAVHANEVVYITEETINYDSITQNSNETQSKWNDKFNKSLEIEKIIERLDTDYEYDFEVYEEKTLKDHYKKLNVLGYENEPDMPIELLGYENLQEVLDTMSNENKEAHIQSVEAARDYNRPVSDFDQKLYEAIIIEKRKPYKKFIVSEQVSGPYKYFDKSLNKEVSEVRGGGFKNIYDTFEQALNAATKIWNEKTFDEKERIKTKQYSERDHFCIGIDEVRLKKNYCNEEILSLASDDYPNSKIDVLLDFAQPEKMLEFQLYCCQLNDTEFAKMAAEFNIFSELSDKIIEGSLNNKELMKIIDNIEKTETVIKNYGIRDSNLNTDIVHTFADLSLNGEYFDLSMFLCDFHFSLKKGIELLGISKDNFKNLEPSEVITIFRNSEGTVNNETFGIFTAKGIMETLVRHELYDIKEALEGVKEIKSKEKSLTEGKVKKADKPRIMGNAR